MRTEERLERAVAAGAEPNGAREPHQRDEPLSTSGARICRCRTSSISCGRTCASTRSISTVRSNRDADAFYVRFTYTDRDVATRVTERLGRLFIDLNAKDRGQLAEATNEFLESQLAETRTAARRAGAEAGAVQTAECRPAADSARVEHAGDSEHAAGHSGPGRIARPRSRSQADARTALQRCRAGADGGSARRRPPLPSRAEQADRRLTAVALPPANSSPSRERRSRALQLRLDARAPRRGPRASGSSPSSRSVSREEAAAPKPAADEPGSCQVPPSPEVAARRERLRQSRAEIDSLERQIAFKEAEEKRLRDTLATYQRRIEEIPGVESEWIALTRDYDTQQAAYKNLLAKSEQSKVAVELERRQIGEQFRVLDPARPPVRPTGVNRLQVNAIGSRAGLIPRRGAGGVAGIPGPDVSFDRRTSGCAPAADHRARSVRDPRRGSPTYAACVRLIAARRGHRTRGGGRLGFWVLELWKFVV